MHAADIAADLGTVPEAAGLEAIVRGFGLVGYADDHEILERQLPVYDALYAYCKAGLVNKAIIKDEKLPLAWPLLFLTNSRRLP